MEFTEEQQPKRPLTAGTTSNGLPWGTNIGRLAAGFGYGWVAKKGLEAAQDRVNNPEPDDDDWQWARTGLSSGLSWFFFICLTITYGLGMASAAIQAVASWFPPMNPGNFDYVPPTQAEVTRHGIQFTLCMLFVIAVSVATIFAARALVARTESRRRGRYLGMFKRAWVAWLFLFIVPGVIAWLPINFID